MNRHTLRPFLCPRCRTASKILTSKRLKPGGWVRRYRVCKVCDLYFVTLQRTAGSEIEEIISEKRHKRHPVPMGDHHIILNQYHWNCEDCKFRSHCDSIVATRAALPCEKYMYLDENPDLLEPRNLPYDHGSIQMNRAFTIALIWDEV